MLRLLFGPTMAVAMVMGAQTGKRDAGGGLLRLRGYEDNDPKTDMCELGFHMSEFPLSVSRNDHQRTKRKTDISGGAVLDDRLWIHGGYVGYNNGTQSAAPSML